MPEAPQPNYEYDVKRLVKAFEQALKDVQRELDTLFLTDFERAQIIAVEKSISNILSDMTKYGDEWASVTMTTAATEGIASSIYALGLASTFKDALKVVKFNTTNKRLVDAAIADTQADLLAVTQNIERQAKLAIRKATAEAMRYKLTRGINATQDISKEIRQRIVKATDVAIIDARGNRWKVGNYADMLARTKMMHAHREAAINEALSEGAYYGRISKHNATDKCRLWEGKIVKLTLDAPGDFVYIGDIPRNELWHPQCRHLCSPLRNPSKYNE